MATGDFSAVLDTLEFDTDVGQFPDIIHISGDVFAVAYGGPESDGWLCTFTVDSSGTIGNSVIDTLEFNSSNCVSPRIVAVSGDIYAIAYQTAASNAEITTVDIDSSGNIGAAVIDRFAIAPTNINPWIRIIHISGEIFAVVYADADGDGQVLTIDIDSSGNIGATAIDTLEFDTTQGITPFIFNVSGTMYGVAYQGANSDGFVVTFNITNAGVIDDSVTDSLEFDIGQCTYPEVLNVSGDVYAIAYMGVGLDGFVKTLTISSIGTISAVIATLEFDTDNGETPSFRAVKNDLFAIAYDGTDGDGFLVSFTISAAGAISAVIDTLEFDTDRCRNPSLILVPDSGGVLAVAYEGTDSDGFVKSTSIAFAPTDRAGYIWMEWSTVCVSNKLSKTYPTCGSAAATWSNAQLLEIGSVVAPFTGVSSTSRV